MKDQQAATAKFHNSNEALRQDLPGVAETFDNLFALTASLQRRQSDTERDRIIKTGVFAGGTAVLFPPFHRGEYSGGQATGLGHSFILSPPPIDSSSTTKRRSIDGIGLISILVGIALVSWAASSVRWSNHSGAKLTQL